MLSACATVHAAEVFSHQRNYMLGDWNGKRSELQQQGYDFSIGYTGEFASLFDAKYANHHADAYTGQLSLVAQFDLDKILNWQDSEAKIAVTYRDGHSLSQTADALNGQNDTAVGQLSSVQELWGRGQTWRLTDFWIQKKFLDQRLAIKLGRFGEAEEFNSFDCKFQNLALCGSQVGNWAGDQWYNWPVSQWAMRVKYAIQPDLFVQAGVFEHNAENLKRSKGFNLSSKGSNGALLPIEVIWQPMFSDMAGEYRAGYVYSTVDRSSQDTAIDQKQAYWMSAKQQLSTVDGNNARGLSAFIQATWFEGDADNPDDAQIADMQNIGLSYVGLFAARAQDELAIGVSRIHKQQTGFSHEYNSELYYAVQVNNWLTIKPNIQYIHHIGALKSGNNAWVGGIKFDSSF
nr:carbohydrate porin [Acinetobacter larvae]